MLTYHWGFWVDSNKPATGVVSIHSVPGLMDHIDGASSVNLSGLLALADHLRQMRKQWEGEYWQNAPDLAPEPGEPSPELIAQWETDYWDSCPDNGPATYLLGFVLGEGDKWEPDPAAEFSAIVDFDSMVTQIVRSRWVRRGALCSPCYPGQIDLGNPGDWLGFDFPETLYAGEQWRENPADWLRWSADENRAIDREGDSIF